MNCNKKVIYAKAVREAMMFRSNDRSRIYLCGVFIEESGQVTATDGHTLYTCKGAVVEPLEEQAPIGDIILMIHGTIPKSALTLELTINGSEGFVVYRNGKGRELGRCAAQTIDAQFPSYNQVLPQDGENNKLTNRLHLDLKYMARAAAVFPHGARVEYKDDNSPVVFKSLSDDDMSPTVVLMTIRVD